VVVVLVAAAIPRPHLEDGTRWFAGEANSWVDSVDTLGASAGLALAGAGSLGCTFAVVVGHTRGSPHTAVRREDRDYTWAAVEVVADKGVAAVVAVVAAALEIVSCSCSSLRNLRRGNHGPPFLKNPT